VTVNVSKHGCHRQFLFQIGRFLKIFWKLNTEPSIGASHQVSVHLAKQFQRRFLEINQPETRIAYGSHVC
jgi:hypothetical protein